jgi:cytochrome c
MTRLLAALALALSLAPAAWAEDRATTREADAMLKSAAALVGKDGPEKALAAFNDPKGQFVFRDLYITAYDLKGTCLADGAFASRVGRPALGEKDAEGKTFVQEQIEMAKEQGHGWTQYKAVNPVTKAVEDRMATLKRIGDLVLVCGAFKK